MTPAAVATTRQRRAVLSAIDRAERRMLPPGWDTGLESQFGSALTEPAAPETTAAPTEKPCPPALCDQQNPACAGRCRYREAAQALGPQRQAMPADVKQRKAQRRALIKWLLMVGASLGLSTALVFSR